MGSAESAQVGRAETRMLRWMFGIHANSCTDFFIYEIINFSKVYMLIFVAIVQLAR